MASISAVFGLLLLAGVAAAQEREPADATDPSTPPRVHGAAIEDGAVSDLSARARAAALAAEAAARADNEITSRAGATARAAQSEAMQALVNEMSPGVLKALGVEDGAGTVSDSDAPPLDRPELLPLVFVSSSIPLATMRAYAEQLEEIGGAMVLRGGLKGLQELRPTIDYIMDVLRVDPACEGADCNMRNVAILIDPVLFREAGATQVPAVAVVDHDPFQSYCDRTGETALHGAWRLTYGDASIEAHLDALSLLGDWRARRLSATLLKERLE